MILLLWSAILLVSGVEKVAAMLFAIPPSHISVVSLVSFSDDCLQSLLLDVRREA